MKDEVSVSFFVKSSLYQNEKLAEPSRRSSEVPPVWVFVPEVPDQRSCTHTALLTLSPAADLSAFFFLLLLFQFTF